MYRSTLPAGTISRTPSYGGYVETFDDARFASQVVGSSTPVMVDCWAPWCGPCRGMDPTVKALAQEWGGSIRVGKLDVTTNPNTTRQYGLSSLPVFLVFRNGAVVGRVVGYQSKENLKALVERAAGKAAR